jgi:hypothetical protein
LHHRILGKGADTTGTSLDIISIGPQDLNELAASSGRPISKMKLVQQTVISARQNYAVIEVGPPKKHKPHWFG